MTVTFGSTAAAGSTGSGTSRTTALVVGALDTQLLILAGNDTGNGPPTTVSYGGVNLTNDLIYNPVAGMNLSAWRMNSPPAGTANMVATWPTGTTGFCFIGILLRGSDLTRLPSYGTGATATSTAAACTGPAGGANDLQLGFVMGRSTTCASAGAPQSVVTCSPTMPVVNINTLDSFSADQLTPASPGNFSWTLISGRWVAVGLTVFAPTSNANPAVSGSKVSGSKVSGAPVSGATVSSVIILP